MKKGDKVHWNWAGSEAEGTVDQKYTEPVTRKIKGTEVKRNASKEDPAYMIKQENGNRALHSESELTKGPKKKS